MSDWKSPDHLGLITDEMLGGLKAGESMRLRVLRAAKEDAQPRRKPIGRLVPALCCAAVALACVGAVSLTPRLSGISQIVPQMTEKTRTVEIETIAAGKPASSDPGVMIADLAGGARMRSGSSAGDSLFESAGGDIALVAFEGRVYRMLKTPKDIGEALIGGQVASVSEVTDQPSLASRQAMADGLSNVADAGSAILSVKGLDESTAVIAKVGGKNRLFQRVSYAGRGPGGQGLEDVLDVRGKVAEMTLSDVGTLSGEEAERVMGVLLDQATLKSADAGTMKQNLTVTLESGLKLQVGVSGDTLGSCGSWSCPEFFEAFESAL